MFTELITRNLSRIIIVLFVIIGLTWCGMKLTEAAKNLEQASHERMAKIDSIFDKN